VIRACFTLVFALFLSACASTTRFYEGPEKATDQVAVVTSSTAPATVKLLKGAFGKTPGLRVSTLHKVDGKPGPNFHHPYAQFYNSTWDWSLRAHLLPGEHSLVVMPNHASDVSTPRVKIAFTAEAGHNYFLGQILEAAGLTYRWQAVLVDQTMNTLVFPTTITWKPE